MWIIESVDGTWWATAYTDESGEKITAHFDEGQSVLCEPLKEAYHVMVQGHGEGVLKRVEEDATYA